MLAIKSYLVDIVAEIYFFFFLQSVDKFFIWVFLQNERKEVLLGPMKLYQAPMQVGFVLRFRHKNIQSCL